MIPKHLSMKNFLSHDTSDIDFDKFDSALIVGTYDNEPDQSNGAGKSAIFEAITWALFDKSRHKKKDGVVKWDKKACEVEFEFIVDDILYKIKRGRDKTLGDSDVEFRQWNGTDFDDISCDTNTATDKKIMDTINVNYDVFINSVYFKQNDISMFAESTPSKRKDLLKSLLRMDKWDKYQNKTKDRLRTLSALIQEKSQQVVPIDKVKEDLEKCKIDVDELRRQIKNNNNTYSQLNSEMIKAKLEYQSVSNSDTIERLKRLQREFASAKKRLGEIENLKNTNDTEIKQCSDQISILQQKINIFKAKMLEAKDINLEDFRTKLIHGRTKEKILYTQLKALEAEEKINLVNECDRCGRSLTKKEVEKIVSDRKDLLAQTKLRYAEVKDQLSRAEAKLKDKEGIVNDSNNAQLEKAKAELKISKLKSMIDGAVSTNERMSEEQKEVKRRNFEEEISKLQSISLLRNAEDLQIAIADLDRRIQEIKRKGDKLNVEYGSKTRRKEELIRTEQEQVKLQKEIDRINNEFSMYDKLKGYFGRDGIQSVIIENIIEELENYANDTLSKICNEPTSISIETQKQTDSGSWNETFDISVKSGSRSDDFETFSGGEQFRISLALRLALSNILAKRMGGTIKFLLLDEVSSNLDNKGLEMFINIVKQLSTEMKILIITHSEKLKDKFEDVIVVDKGPTGSKVAVQ